MFRMKKYLNYLTGLMLAMAAVPASSQTLENPQVLVNGENTVTEAMTYFTYTAPENQLVKIDGIASPYRYRVQRANDSGDPVDVPYAYNQFGTKFMAFNAQKGMTYTFGYQNSMNQVPPYTFTCTMTPLEDGNMLGAECSDPIVLPQDGGQRLFPFDGENVSVPVYAVYTVEKEGRLLIKSTDSFSRLKIGYSCDDISEVWTNEDYDPSTGLTIYNESLMVEEGDIIYIQATGWSAVLVSVEVEEVSAGTSCKDPYNTEIGENRIPAAAGTYWYKVTNTSSELYAIIVESDAKYAAGVYEACGKEPVNYPSLNFRTAPVDARASRWIRIVKNEATPETEYFNLQFADLEPIEDKNVGQALSPGKAETTPAFNGSYYYSITSPEGSPKLMVVSSDADESQYEWWDPAIKVTELGKSEQLNSTDDSSVNFSMQTVPGMTYILTLYVKNDNPITFTVSFEDLEEGSLATYPLTAKMGANDVPPFSPVYYAFTVADACKVKLSSDIADVKISAQSKNSWGTLSDLTLTESDNGWTLKLEAKTEYLFTLDKKNGQETATGNFTIEQAAYAPGEFWQTAFLATSGTVGLPDSPMEVWYKLKSPMDGLFTLSSNMSAANYDNQICVYIGSADVTPIILEKDWNSYPDEIFSAFKTGVFKGQLIYVKFLSNDRQSDITATFGFEEAAPGEASSTAIPITYEDGGVTYDFPGNLGYDAATNSYEVKWYSVELPAGIVSITSTDKIKVDLYSPDNTTLPLVSGSSNRQADYGILAYSLPQAGSYLFTVTDTSNTDETPVTARILVRDPLPGESVETAVEVSKPNSTVTIPESRGTDYYIKILAYPGVLNITGEKEMYVYGYLYKEGDLINEVAELEPEYDYSTYEVIYGIRDFKVSEQGVYILRVNSNTKANGILTFTGSALENPNSGSVTVRVSVENGASYSFNVPFDTATGFSLALPVGFVVETATLNGEDIDATDSYVFTVGEEDMEYDFTVGYDGDIEIVDETTGIVEIGAGLKASVVDGKLRIEGTQVGDAVVVYSTGGMKVGSHIASTDGIDIALPSGAYVVRINDNAVKAHI